MGQRVDHHILGFDISMHNPFGVKIAQPRADLYHDIFDGILVQIFVVNVAVVSVILAEIHLEELKDHIHAILSHKVVDQRGYVRMFALA